MLGKVSERSKVERRGGGAREGLVVIDGLSVPGHVTDFGLRANGGEIVAIAGQVGSGASEVLRALAGPDSGRARPRDDRRPRHAPRRAAEVDPGGVVFASNDRKGEGLFLRQSVARNLLATRLKAVSHGGFLNRRLSSALARRLAGMIGFDRKRLGAAVETLSGGNQQKVFLGRCIEKEGVVLLMFDEPTRGVDVGGRADIHNLVRHAASTGNCVIFVSSELDEIVDLADTVVTMFAGRITRIGRREEMTAARHPRRDHLTAKPRRPSHDRRSTRLGQFRWLARRRAIARQPGDPRGLCVRGAPRGAHRRRRVHDAGFPYRQQLQGDPHRDRVCRHHGGRCDADHACRQPVLHLARNDDRPDIHSVHVPAALWRGRCDRQAR